MVNEPYAIPFGGICFEELRGVKRQVTLVTRYLKSASSMYVSIKELWNHGLKLYIPEDNESSFSLSFSEAEFENLQVVTNRVELMTRYCALNASTYMCVLMNLSSIVLSYIFHKDNDKEPEKIVG